MLVNTACLETYTAKVCGTSKIPKQANRKANAVHENVMLRHTKKFTDNFSPFLFAR